MAFDFSDLATLLRPERRYQRQSRLWVDGPYEGWEAFDHVLGRKVILCIAYQSTGPTRLIRRAEILAALRHPNIPPVYDLGILEDGRPFFTAPMIEARPLDTLLRQRDRPGDRPLEPLPLRPLVRAVRDVCRAVEHAHRRGFVHLDLCPDNVLISPDFQEVLVVEGWEPMEGRDQRESGPSDIIGHPTFMSPEQVIEGRSGVGPVTDVFGVGGILHVILFGTPPNHLPGRTSSIEVITAIAQRAFEPRRSGTLRPGIRSSEARRGIDRLVGICLKALAYHSKERYPTAADLGDALDGWLEPDRSSWWEMIRWR
jgi:serine/threonine-protein kinase